MFSSLFILSLTSRSVLLQRRWCPHTQEAGSARAAVSSFFSSLAAVDDCYAALPTVVVAPSSYLLHHRASHEIVFLVSTQGELPPLVATEFLRRLERILVTYTGGGEMTEKAVEEGLVLVAQIVDEIVDGGVPVETEESILRSMIAPPSMMNRVASAVTGQNFTVSERLPEGIETHIPWRKTNVKYSNNEIYFDIEEEIDALFDSNGMLVTCDIHGAVNIVTKLSGCPQLVAELSDHAIIEDCRFHRCVNRSRWQAERVLSFIPPDGPSTLMQYRVARRGGRAVFPIYVKPHINFSGTSGRVNIMVGQAANTAQMETAQNGKNSNSSGGSPNVEDITVHIPLPSTTAHADLHANHGSVTVDLVARECVWAIGRLPREATPLLEGYLHLGNASAPMVQGVAMGGGGGGGEKTPPPPSVSSSSSSASSSSFIDESPVVSVKFSVAGVNVSGLGVASLGLVNESYKMFKGFKVATRAGRFEIRT